MHCNSRQPDVAQSLSPLFSSPVPSLNLVSLSVAVLERFYCIYVTLRCYLELWLRDLDLWPLTLNICSRPGPPLSNSERYLSLIGQFAAELLQFDLIWPYDLEHISRVALCSGIVCTKYKLSQAISSWNVTIFGANTPYHAMTLTFHPLTLKVCSRSVSRGHSL